MFIKGNWTSILRGIGGELEINRTIGAIGAAAYIVTVPIMLIVEEWNNRAFDLVAYCTAYPAGLAIAVGAIAGAVALKDSSVAKAKATMDEANNNAGPSPNN